MGNLFDEKSEVISNECLYGRLYLMVLHAPSIAEALKPGQFVHAKLPGMESRPLRRPFSVYAADAERGTIDILYQVVGVGSDHMTTLGTGSVLDLIGPVGNGWLSTCPGKKIEGALLVGGGVGSAPVFELGCALIDTGAHVDVVLGAQTKDALVSRQRYADLLGREPYCSTDDGSFGYAGFATGLVEQRLDAGFGDTGKAYDYVAVCGPAPLMRIVSGLVLDRGITCEVSLERRMACGIGACLSCVCDTETMGRKRVCVDGPVFDAKEVSW